MPRKKAANATETHAEAIDKIFSQVDAEVLLAGALGGIASAYGMYGPFTRLMMGISASSGMTQDVLSSITKDADSKRGLLDAATFLAAGPMFSVPGVLAGIFFQSEKKVIDLGNGQTATVDKTAEEKNAENAARAMIASGALEGMMMMAFMKNPGSMTLISELLSGAKSGLGAIATAL